MTSDWSWKGRFTKWKKEARQRKPTTWSGRPGDLGVTDTFMCSLDITLGEMGKTGQEK